MVRAKTRAPEFADVAAAAAVAVAAAAAAVLISFNIQEDGLLL